jgi:NAD(P)H-flavin reductase
VAIWVVDRFLRIVRLCYCNLHVSLSNERLVKASATQMVYDKSADVVRIEVTPGTPLLHPSPGQYYFLYQPFRLTGWESHPFTIGAWSYEIGDRTSLSPKSLGKMNNSLDVSHVPLLARGSTDADYRGRSTNALAGEEKSLKLKLIYWVRPYDGWTRELRQQCLRSPNLTSETTVLLEGPYGNTFPLWRYESVLIIVGGTGIASAVPYIQDHLRRSDDDWEENPENEKTRVRDIELIWTTRQAPFIHDVSRRELKLALERDDFSASFYVTRDSTASTEDPNDLGYEIQGGRPHLQSLIMSRACDASSAGSSLVILVCGPRGMADEARAATHLAMRQGHRFIKFVEESFTW